MGTRIKTARKRAGMTQTELGNILGVSGSMIAQYETGARNPKYETLQRIADALTVDISELLTPDQAIGFMKQFFKDGNEGAQIVVNISKKHGLSLDTADKIVKDVAWEYRNEFHTTQEGKLREAVAGLNDDGRKEVFDCAIRRACELAEIPRYQKTTTTPLRSNKKPQAKA